MLKDGKCEPQGREAQEALRRYIVGVVAVPPRKIPSCREVLSCEMLVSAPYFFTQGTRIIVADYEKHRR